MESTTANRVARRRLHGRLLASSGSRPANRGFTLVELVTTLVIIGILTAYAAPHLFDGDNSVFAERGYADEVASAVRHAQRIAVASQCRVRITINASDYTAEQQAGAMQPDGCRNGAWGTPVRRIDGSNLVGVAPAGVVVVPAVVLTFDSQGALAGGVALDVNGRFAVNIAAGSGLVTVVPQ